MMKIDGSNLVGSPFWMGMPVDTRREWLELFIDVHAVQQYYAQTCGGKFLFVLLYMIFSHIFFL